MAVASFFSTAKPFIHLSTPNSFSPNSSMTTFSLQKHNAAAQNTVLCKASTAAAAEHVSLSKRSLALSMCSGFLLSLVGKAEATPLEAEDDLELLEKVKQDRKKRLERQGRINSSLKEKGYLQEVVYKLSKVGQAIENSDLNAASSVLGFDSDSEWIKKANSAFGKLTESEEEKAEVDTFNTSISQLISSVGNKDVDSSKIAFVSSATAFEKWTTLTGLDAQLKGL